MIHIPSPSNSTVDSPAGIRSVTADRPVRASVQETLRKTSKRLRPFRSSVAATTHVTPRTTARQADNAALYTELLCPPKRQNPLTAGGLAQAVATTLNELEHIASNSADLPVPCLTNAMRVLREDADMHHFVTANRELLVLG
jgi:hypothetical protein